MGTGQDATIWLDGPRPANTIIPPSVGWIMPMQNLASSQSINSFIDVCAFWWEINNMRRGRGVFDWSLSEHLGSFFWVFALGYHIKSKNIDTVNDKQKALYSIIRTNSKVVLYIFHKM